MSLWKKITKRLRSLIPFLLVVGACTVLIVAVGWWYYHPSVERTDGIVYGQRNGESLYLDVIRPTKPNGYGVALMVSGGWKSQRPGEVPVWLLAPVLRRGYTVFAVMHVSQPDSTVMEIIDDVNRGIRFIRYHHLVLFKSNVPPDLTSHRECY